jgi:hypothetical protein
MRISRVVYVGTALVLCLADGGSTVWLKGSGHHGRRLPGYRCLFHHTISHQLSFTYDRQRLYETDWTNCKSVLNTSLISSLLTDIY